MRGRGPGRAGGRLAGNLAAKGAGTCAHLAGSYRGLASPDDRYEGGGERNTGLVSSQRLNTRADARARSAHGQLKDNDPGKRSWGIKALERKRCFVLNQRAKSECHQTKAWSVLRTLV